MIITRSPLRVSFSGGGTDIPAFYRDYGPGVVVSTSINRYVYVTLNKKFDGKVSVRYRVHEMTDSVYQLNHPLIRECLLAYGIEKGIELVIVSEVPARGSGLGASSALAVALCLALEKFTKESRSQLHFGSNYKKALAAYAAHIEIAKVGSPIGKQDHYASAVGGLNLLKFNADESVIINRYEPDDFYHEIESQSMLFYLDIEHEYHGGSFVQKILRDQVQMIPEKFKSYILQRDNALRMWEHMEYAVPERFIDHINENWRIKRSLHEDISNGTIDEYIKIAYASGATAAKVCGSGGGGFLYLMTPPSMQNNVREALNDLHELHFKFDQKGAECIFEEKEEYAAVKN